ncbi:nucleotidyltransferase family protein [Brevibacterium sp. RIT 803]|uniref:nucleotidyltransferase family protein n=1 Tax=Brevibacterium sp. RIT 803 TaxID=2810210 RepID=UPI00194FBCD4|nr:nucleotidyltransferase family protein [Brevibacterium sp. RIT 803]MBM6591501.1 nucleotidyltransferase family protein [Brevibacterium sp. RIT 803]
MVRAMKRKVSMIVLAAGSGSRMGAPKALLRLRSGTSVLEHHVHTMAAAHAWGEVQQSEDSLEIIVVLGASADVARPLVPAKARVVENPDFASGMGSSLQVGLRAVAADAEAAIVTLVDLPETPVEAYRRLVEHSGTEVLARCTWNTALGHPVMIGRDLISEAIAACHEDRGARSLFRERSCQVLDIECGDLLAPGVTGNRDVDTPADAQAQGLVLPTTGMSDHA